MNEQTKLSSTKFRSKWGYYFRKIDRFSETKCISRSTRCVKCSFWIISLKICTSTNYLDPSIGARAGLHSMQTLQN